MKPTKPSERKGLPLLWHGVGSLITAMPAAVLLTLIWNMVLSCFPWQAQPTEYALPWQAMLGMLPMILAPAWCIWGIIRGAVNRGKPGAIGCAIMSVFGLVLSLMLCVMIYAVTTGMVVA